MKTPKGFEVDFLARYPSGHVDLIQICAEAVAPDTAQRETACTPGGGASLSTARSDC